MKQLLGVRVERAIRAHIAQEGLKEGDPLPSELELAQMLDVSKSTVRESIRRLEAVGYVTIRHGVGLRVGNFSIRPVVSALPYDLLDRAKGLKDILEVRAVLEESFLAQASGHFSEDHLRLLEDVVERMEAASEHGEVDKGLDEEFHAALYAPLDNALVSDLISAFWQVFDSARTALDLTLNFHAVQEHRDILTALRIGDETGVRTSMQNHFRQIRSQLDRYLQEDKDVTHRDLPRAADRI